MLLVCTPSTNYKAQTSSRGTSSSGVIAILFLTVNALEKPSFERKCVRYATANSQSLEIILPADFNRCNRNIIVKLTL